MLPFDEKKQKERERQTGELTMIFVSCDDDYIYVGLVG